MKKANPIISFLVIVSVFMIFMNQLKTGAQDLPAEVKAIVGMDMDHALEKLEALDWKSVGQSSSSRRKIGLINPPKPVLT